MKFLVDAHLPRRLAQWLHGLRHEAMHTLDLPMRNRTRDTEINDISIREQAIIITKDAAFVNSFTFIANYFYSSIKVELFS